MWKWFLKKIRSMLSSSPDYKLDFTIDNINKINTKILMNTKITVIMNNKQAPINIYDLNKTLKEFERVLDEEVDYSMPIEYGCILSQTSSCSLSSLLYDNGYLPDNHLNTLKTLLVTFKNTHKLYNDVLSNEDIKPSMVYNCNLFRLYIIIMEDIINKLFISISKID